MRKFYGYLEFKMCIEKPSKQNFKYLVLAIWVMKKKKKKNIWFHITLLFFLCLKSEQHVLFLHREMAMFFVACLALNIRIIFKTQKAEGFWQNSRIISHPSILIVLWFFSSCWGLGGRRGGGVSSGNGCSNGSARCHMSNREEKTRILYSVFSMRDYCTMDLSSGWQS